MWVYDNPQAAGHDFDVFRKDVDDQNSCFLRVNENKTIRFHFEIVDDCKYTSSSNSALGTFRTGQLNHLVVTINASDAALRLYLNGVDVTAVTAINLSTPLSLPGSATTLGYSDTKGEIAGALDDMQIYDHALSFAEVQALSGSFSRAAINLSPYGKRAFTLAVRQVPAMLKGPVVPAIGHTVLMIG